jgi:hypothetical protein
MPFCGFNEKMLEGLAAFYRGLVEHGLLERKKKGASIDNVIDSELGDIANLLENLHLIEDSSKRNLVESLARHAYVFYELVKQRGVKNQREIIEGLTKFYGEMDRKYYSELEGQPNAMRNLAEYLNELK